MPIADIMARVMELVDEHSHIHHFVITGGEPLLQPKLNDFLKTLKETVENAHITIETNGTIYAELTADFLSISPKLSSSVPRNSEFEAMHEKSRLNFDALQSWLDQYDCQFKFVVDREDDGKEIHDILKGLKKVNDEQIYLMPQGINQQQLDEHTKTCIELANDYGWRYTPRKHIELYGLQRGT